MSFRRILLRKEEFIESTNTKIIFHKLLFIYAIIFYSKSSFGILPLNLIAAVAFFSFFLLNEKSIYSPVLWLFFSLISLLDLLTNLPTAANHQFVFFYLCLISFSALLLEKRVTDNQYLFDNSRWLLILIFLFAGIQKLDSSEFWDGSFISFMTAIGEMLPGLDFFSDNFKEINNFNKAELIGLMNKDPFIKNTVVFKAPFNSFQLVSRTLSILIIFSEILIALLFLFFEKKSLTHLAFIIFLFFTLLIRPECGFLALIASLGFVTSDKSKPIFQKTYIAFVILCLSLAFTNIGFI